MGHQQSSTTFLLFAQCHWVTTYSVFNDILLPPANERSTNTGYSAHGEFTLRSIWEDTTSICFLQKHFCPWSVAGMEHHSPQLSLAFRLSYHFLEKFHYETPWRSSNCSQIYSALIPPNFHLLQTTYFSLGRSENCPTFGFCYSSCSSKTY